MITGDGGFTELNREIHNSMGRVKAAKFGVMNKEITPFHNSSFFLPDASNYFPDVAKGKMNFKPRKKASSVNQRIVPPLKNLPE